MARDGIGDRLANGLGWFSLGLGAAGSLHPPGLPPDRRTDDDARTLQRVVGVPGRSWPASASSTIGGPSAGSGTLRGDPDGLAPLGTAFGAKKTDKGGWRWPPLSVLGMTAADAARRHRRAVANPGPRRSARKDRSPRNRRRPTARRRGLPVLAQRRELPAFHDPPQGVKTTGNGRSHWTAKGRARRSSGTPRSPNRPNELIAWRSLPGAASRTRGRALRAGAGRTRHPGPRQPALRSAGRSTRQGDATLMTRSRPAGRRRPPRFKQLLERPRGRAVGRQRPPERASARPPEQAIPSTRNGRPARRRRPSQAPRGAWASDDADDRGATSPSATGARGGAR